jgi:hypothetical protein
METQGHPSRQPIQFGLSLVAGGGLVLMIVALGVGVVNAEAANGGLVGTLFIAGLLLLIAGIGAWIGYTRPFAHFDDINEPKYTGHAHDHHDDHAEAEQVLLPDGMSETPALTSGEGQAVGAQ